MAATGVSNTFSGLLVLSSFGFGTGLGLGALKNLADAPSVIPGSCGTTLDGLKAPPSPSISFRTSAFTSAS
eukprot:6626309-Alexandrium_andersonii.AAC.1